MPLNRLTDAVIENAVSAAKPVRMFDGGSMYLEVAPSGGKWWRLKYRFGGKEKRLSLGCYPEVSIDRARMLRADMRAMISDGIDPSEYRKAVRVARAAEGVERPPPFSLDSNGGLSLRLGSRYVILTPTESGELRVFLDATRAVAPKATPCP